MVTAEIWRWVLIANAIFFAIGFVSEGLGEWRMRRRQRRIAEIGEQLRKQTEQLRAQVLEDRLGREVGPTTDLGFGANGNLERTRQRNIFYADDVIYGYCRVAEPEPYGTVERR